MYSKTMSKCLLKMGSKVLKLTFWGSERDKMAFK